MIRTAADLFNQIREHELGVISAFRDVGHGPMIGAMYEGLTKNLLERVIFDGIDLHVVSGKIINQAGQLSDQIDCMVVTGMGERMPNTDFFVYPLSQVLAVVEVRVPQVR